MIIQRGFRDKLEKYLNVNSNIDLDMSVQGNSVFDYTCFGVDANGKLSDDRYMVFYNQTQSPNGEIVYSASGNGAHYTINLSRLPISINKLVFTVSIDGNGTMGNISKRSLSIKQNGNSVIDLSLSGSDFHSEKAIISIEIYRKDVWRVAAVASGFNGGLSDLLKAFGGEEIQDTTINNNSYNKPIPQTNPVNNPPPTPVVHLEKINLKKGQKVSLDKNCSGQILVENGWTAIGKDYDLKALVRYRNGQQIYVGAANVDELLSTPDGAVRHGGDIKSPGELEHINISWNPNIASVAVSSYSAIENGIGSFREYGVFVRIKHGNKEIKIAAEDASANRKSYTLCFGEIIFGETPNSFEVTALEMYSRPGSENRIGYRNGRVMMDIGPAGMTK